MRFLFWVLVVSWAVRLLGRAIRGAGNKGDSRSTPDSAGQESAASGKRLVKDPICGTYVAEALALPLQTRGEILHFCSPECRAKYESSVVGKAASA